ncbi:MAG: E3 ubiquitin ligase family protein, partial [Cycloclasticus sp.]|nr:E3 ubiquitin ligase family protein [Cycloclasticus sp.]
CLVSLVCLYFYFRYLWRYRIMQDMPTARIRSASQGYNEFEGVAKLLPGDPIIAPLTKRSCVWYWYKVEEKQSHYVRGRSRTSWHIFETGVSDGVFSLHGRTGKAIIDPDDAEVIHSVSDTWYGSSPFPTAGPRGFSSRAFAIGKRYRYSEKRIHEGDELYVLGDFKSFREMDLPTQNESLAAILSQWKSNSQVLLNRFDENRDGHIDSIEWEQAVLIAKNQLMEESIKHSGARIDNLIEKPADSRKPFLISTENEEMLTASFQYKSWASLFLFFVAGALAVWMINVRV